MEDSDIPDFRRAVRGHLAERPAVAQSAETIHRHLRREHGCTLPEIENALTVLIAFKHLKTSQDAMGGRTLFYQATAEGILAHERGE
jgi:hypothetical protein